jgi:general secretion pathway protein D
MLNVMNNRKLYSSILVTISISGTAYAKDVTVIPPLTVSDAKDAQPPTIKAAGSTTLPVKKTHEPVVSKFLSRKKQHSLVSEELSGVSTITEEGETAEVEQPYLSSFLKPWEIGDPNELLEFNFENAEITTIISYIEKKFQLKFISDDDVKPLPAGGKSVLGSKVTYRTYKPLSKKAAWDVFIQLLDMAGIAPVPGPTERTYILKNTAIGTNQSSPTIKSPLPTFIGTDLSLLPDNDTRIRYVYFFENTSLDVIKNLIDNIKSPTASALIPFPELRAFLITDKASNIRSMIALIRDLDKVNMPETLAIVKLVHADAKTVEKLYEDLAKEETQSQTLSDRLRSYRKQPTTTYFSEATRVKAEPRSNSLILLGTKENVEKVSAFIKKEIDKDPDLLPSPLYVYQLKYADAETVANILQAVTKFNANEDAFKFGGIRDGDKYFKSTVTITAEKAGNRVIVNADQDDYQKIKNLLDKIDIEQPQVAIKVLILSIDITDTKDFGIQLRNKVPGPFPTNINAQTSGLAGLGSPVIENPAGTGATRLLGNLIALVAGNAPGSTLMTLGSDAFGVWGLLKILATYSKATVEANPFIIATHKYQSVISIGQTRRVISATVANTTTTNSLENIEANLEVKITPQISVGDGLITLDVMVTLNNFTLPVTGTIQDGNRDERIVQTAVIVGNNETLALGGLIQDSIMEVETKVPILGDVPVLGWIFKNKTKQITRNSLIIFITPEIIPPESHKEADKFTSNKFSEMREVRDSFLSPAIKRDPIHRWFFKDVFGIQQNFEEQIINELVTVNQQNDPHSTTPEAKQEIQELYQPHVIKTMTPRTKKVCKPKRISSLVAEQEQPMQKEGEAV